ncbi:hypothetical protein J2Y69_001292 [Microbacterium resistens]|uniref:ABC transporter n=1 Tax=Microbacterium resistens TaxID=156977 RepID=A0ABU1SAQ6_9MICO|nr:ABC transporter [Microbacterium resistens]MDR6866699.1 hypothetical protein [Microbacterium resistens]
MSDHEGSKPVQGHDVDDVVDSAKAGLADAEAARAGTIDDASQAAAESATDGASAVAADATASETTTPETTASEVAPETTSPGTSASAAGDGKASDAPVSDHDADLAAFAEAEAAFPGTFGGTFTPPPADPAKTADQKPDQKPEEETAVLASAPPAAAHAVAEPEVATTAYAPPSAAELAETRVLPSEPVLPADTAQAQLPIFVQAPEAPRPRGNRGTIAGIGLLAALSFAILYLGAALGLGALEGRVTGENIGTVVLDHLRSWTLWIPTAVFFIGFWLLGAIINRGRWGFWVIFGILVGAVAYGGHILGELFAAPFWSQAAAKNLDIVDAQLLAPLAIVALVIGRELTVWFGAWAARSGARKNVRNAEAQREYERVLEAGPQLPG